MSKPYRPSNGSESEIFQWNWCFCCTKDTEASPCDILGRSFWHNIGDLEYPTEWIVDDDGLSNPRCTAFEAKRIDG
jgi:hypothetical protein